MKKTILMAALLAAVTAGAQTTDRWKLADDGAIEWIIDGRLPHNDHIEMSGQQLSAILRYGVDADSAFHVNRALMFPMLRQHPVTRTQAHLKQRIGLDILELVTVSEMTPQNEKVKSITFDGILKVESTLDFIAGRNTVRRGIELTRLH